jgi:hypothetical protein
MIRRALLHFSAAAAIAVSAVTTAAPAQAAPPETATVTDSGTVKAWVKCEGFNIDLTYTETTRITKYFDSSGNVIRGRIAYHGTGTITNSVTGASNTGKSPEIDFYDITGNTLTIVGRTFHNNVRGRGNVALVAGRTVIDLTTGEVNFVAGPHPAFGDIDWCSIVS